MRNWPCRPQILVTILPQDHSKFITGHLLLLFPRPQRKPSDDLRYTFRRKYERISRRGRPKGLCGFPVEMCAFSLYNWRFSRSDHCGKRVWSERRVFIPLKFPSCLLLTELELMAKVCVFTLIPRIWMTKSLNHVAFEMLLIKKRNVIFYYKNVPLSLSSR